VFPENGAAGLALADQVLLVCGFSQLMRQTSSLRFELNSIRNCAARSTLNRQIQRVSTRPYPQDRQQA
jgi:hypothetical protein